MTEIEEMAFKRVTFDPQLAAISDILMAYNEEDAGEYFRWLATAPADDLITVAAMAVSLAMMGDTEEQAAPWN